MLAASAAELVPNDARFVGLAAAPRHLVAESAGARGFARDFERSPWLAIWMRQPHDCQLEEEDLWIP